MKLDDYYGKTEMPLLHAHSIDAAQEAFYKACKTAKANRGIGAHYPHKRKYWRTTIWKNSGIRGRDGYLLLSRAQRAGADPGYPAFPSGRLARQLVWSKCGWYGTEPPGTTTWHLVVDDGQPNAEPPGNSVMAGDLGEIHPITLTDGHTATVISARALRAVRQRTNKRLAEIQAAQARRKKNSRQWQQTPAP